MISLFPVRFNFSFGDQDIHMVSSKGCKADVCKDKGINLEPTLPTPRFVLPFGVVCGEFYNGTVAWKTQVRHLY